jgi:hypothetical protein
LLITLLLLLLTGLREWFSQSDENHVLPRIPVMVSMLSPVPSKKGKKGQDSSMQTSLTMDQSRHSAMLDEESDEDELPEAEQEVDELHFYFAANLYIFFKQDCVFYAAINT